MNTWAIAVVCSILAGGVSQDQIAGAQAPSSPNGETVVVESAPEISPMVAGKPVGHRPTATGHGWIVDWFGPMPQTCYQPRFGCYPGNPRTIHRYPAFHGSYYRNPYNYRHLFEYPWHAQPNEPQPLHGGQSEVLTTDTVEVQPELAPQPDPAIQR
ncbi:hypothetical protein [Thermogutta sp.]|uniref:hypothetical protein n=1 Tax=Thermogutta sp. TaxID=1962930 RepID=UPI00321F6141